jgi:hypothetical protein
MLINMKFLISMKFLRIWFGRYIEVVQGSNSIHSSTNNFAFE